jgi:Ran GTPase-activating protein (RanGAP) involved in mRNA processing and transport
MQEVNLSYGEIDHESALRVADALASKKDIKTIELNGQFLTPLLS